MSPTLAAAAVTLTARGLTKRYGGRTVLDGVDLEVRPDEIVGLLGPNGAGKTTAFRVVAGLVRPDGGSVALGGVDVTRWPLHRRAQLGLGYLPQEPSAFRRLTVRDNLEAVAALRPELTRRDRDAQVARSLERFGLTERAGDIAERLSGGERRRLELARCLVVRPRWLLLDEPFAGIDPLGVSDLQARLRSLRDPNRAVLITDHNVQAALPLCDRAYLLYAGVVVEHGPREALVASRRAQTLYLGPDFRLSGDDPSGGSGKNLP